MSRLFAAIVGALTLVIALGCAGLDLADQLVATPPPDGSYAGDWRGTGMHLVVTPEGWIRVETQGDLSTQFEGPAKSWEGDVIQIGAFGFTTAYRIDEVPYEADGEWRMVVDGIVLVREGDAPDIAPRFDDVPAGAPGALPVIADTDDA